MLIQKTDLDLYTSFGSVRFRFVHSTFTQLEHTLDIQRYFSISIDLLSKCSHSVCRKKIQSNRMQFNIQYSISIAFYFSIGSMFSIEYFGTIGHQLAVLSSKYKKNKSLFTKSSSSCSVHRHRKRKKVKFVTSSKWYTVTGLRTWIVGFVKNTM